MFESRGSLDKLLKCSFLQGCMSLVHSIDLKVILLKFYFVISIFSSARFSLVSVVSPAVKYGMVFLRRSIMCKKHNALKM